MSIKRTKTHPTMPDFPIIAGHRGFKSQYSENTMIGFRKCFETGATSFETDLYLTTDEVLVVCHDVNTNKTYQYENGDEADFIITKSSYEHDLKDLVNIETGDKLLTFNHLLKWFIKFDLANDAIHSIMLDVKTSNLKKISKYIILEALAVEDDINYWLKRLQFGFWDIDFIKYMNQNDFFQDLYQKYQIVEKFQIYHISGNWELSMAYINYNHYLDATYGKERKLIKFTGVSFLYLQTWSIEFLDTFVPFLVAEGISLYNWTINTIFQYNYFVKVCKTAGIIEYGVITDYPDLLQQHKENHYHKLLAVTRETLNLSYYQKFINTVFKILISMIPFKKPNYSSMVDGEFSPPPRRPNAVAMFIFRFCQKMGIF